MRNISIFAVGKMIVEPWILLVFLVVVVLGYGVVHFIANRKWGYTPKRERELENMENQKNGKK